MNEEKQIPIKKVRCITSVKNPLSFEHRKPRDTSNKAIKMIIMLLLMIIT